MALLSRLLAPDSPFQQRFFFLAKRFVAGESIDDALQAVAALNQHGITATLDFLGEDVTSRSEAEATRDTYFTMMEAIRARGVRTNVSVKLTALGLSIDEQLAYDNLRAILDRATTLDDPFVRIDMEGSAVTAVTLSVFERLYATHKNVGPVLQAYLKRTPEDVERMIQLGARVRLCKGAYQEPAEIAHKDMPTIRREYLRLAEALLTRGNYPGIATHDEGLIEAVRAFATERGLKPGSFEFQMLYGVRPELQRKLAAAGYPMRVYIPFGTHWAGYFYRRITERKENAFFALRSMLSR